MSLTSYRAAPPRVGFLCLGRRIESGAGGMRGFGGPGGDLLFRALRRSTIGAEGFHGRVRDGIGCLAPRYGHQAVQSRRARPRALRAAARTAPRRRPGPIRRRPRPAEASCGCLLEEGMPPLEWAPDQVRGTRSADGVAWRNAGSCGACRWAWGG